MYAISWNRVYRILIHTLAGIAVSGDAATLHRLPTTYLTIGVLSIFYPLTGRFINFSVCPAENEREHPKAEQHGA
jgi:hypothetical protein